MLSNIFYYLLSMSIIGSGIGLIIILINKLCSRFLSCKVKELLWLLCGFRLLVPFTFSTKYSLLNMLNTNNLVIVPAKNFSTAFEGSSLSTTNALILVNNHNPMIYKSMYLKRLMDIAAILWFVGFLVSLFALVLFYLMVVNKLKHNELNKVSNKCIDEIKLKLKLKKSYKVLFNKAINTPMIKGIFNRVIYLPKNMDDQYINLSMYHELLHIKRGDNLKKLIALFIVCLHWFNPIIYLCFANFNKDLEGACDESVLDCLDKKYYKQYGLVLLQNSTVNTTPFCALGDKAVKTRILNLINYRNMSNRMIVVSTILIVIFITLMATNPLQG